MVNIEQGFTGRVVLYTSIDVRMMSSLMNEFIEDPSDIIQHSLEMGKPIIVVHVAYRLNVLGYSVFKDKTNFGFHDQKRAVEWVIKNIDDFGGDKVRTLKKSNLSLLSIGGNYCLTGFRFKLPYLGRAQVLSTCTR
jgi:hypothetical protein